MQRTAGRRDAAAGALAAALLVMIAAQPCGVLCLKMRNFEVPLHVVRGETTELKCQFDLEGERLYSVKWYKGGREFFRYVPNEHPTKLRYDVQGVWVNMEASTGQTVVLRDVSLATSGRYKCEVLAEAPSFNTLTEHAILTVVDLPEEKPVVESEREKYKSGDLVAVNCTSAPSKPAAFLTWYINDKEADRSHLVHYQPALLRNGLEQSTLGLRFMATEYHFSQGHMTLRCTAYIGVTPPALTPYGRGTKGGKYRNVGHHTLQPALSLQSREHRYGTGSQNLPSPAALLLLLLLLLLDRR